MRSLLRAPISMCQPATGGKSDKPGVNVSKYASQRSIISAEKDVTPKEINELLVRAGKPVCFDAGGFSFPDSQENTESFLFH